MKRHAKYGFFVPLTIFVLIAGVPVAAKNVRKLTLRDLDGNKTRFSEYQGKVVVLNFWATWCGACKEEIPRLSEISQQYAEKNVVFLLASIEESKKLSAVKNYVSEHKITLPVWTGASIDLLEDLSGINVVPATLIIDEKGEIVRTINGEARTEDVKEAVEWLLNGRTGPVPSDHVKRY